MRIEDKEEGETLTASMLCFSRPLSRKPKGGQSEYKGPLPKKREDLVHWRWRLREIHTQSSQT